MSILDRGNLLFKPFKVSDIPMSSPSRENHIPFVIL